MKSSSIRFSVFRFQYRSNKESKEEGEPVLHDVEITLTADNMFDRPVAEEPQQNQQGEFEIDLSHDGSGQRVGVHPTGFGQEMGYNDDYDMQFLTKSNSPDVASKPRGRFNKKCNVKDDSPDVLEISEFILQRANGRYDMEVSLLPSAGNGEIYALETIEISGHNIYLHISVGHNKPDLDNKKFEETINIEEELEVVAVIDGTPLSLGHVQIWEE